MKTAQEVMTKDVATVQPYATVAEAIQHMRDRRVGSLLVERVSPSDTWGIITQTDVVCSCLMGTTSSVSSAPVISFNHSESWVPLQTSCYPSP
jgi:signal-transduction protein with cAMP-binding, CBS, and nucleotidyltransferase domain